MSRTHIEKHLVQRIGWLRAAVLGANDGIISTASLILGVAAAAVSKSEVLVAGVAGLVAGAMSMAAGEYVSVSSQADTEQADIARERRELRDNPEFEREELAQIYVARGLELGLANEVARQLMAKDALAVHARDELGISELSTARPVQAALGICRHILGRRRGSSRSRARVPFEVAVAGSSSGPRPSWPCSGFSDQGRRCRGAQTDPSRHVLGAFAMALTAGIGALIGKAV